MPKYLLALICRTAMLICIVEASNKVVEVRVALYISALLLMLSAEIIENSIYEDDDDDYTDNMNDIAPSGS